MKELLMAHAKEERVLTEQQHGFVPMKSCVTNLLLARESWLRNKEDGCATDVVYVDFSKAFDRVEHAQLLRMLDCYHFPPHLIAWIADFLALRKFQVRVNGVLSEKRHILSGVPQGSVLGPILFCFYVNQLPRLLSSSCLLFADDLKIWRATRTDEDSTTLQNDVDVLVRSAAQLQLPINVDKCQHLHIGAASATTYTLNGSVIRSDNVVRDLGVLVRSDFKTCSHTDLATSRGLRLLWALRRAFTLWTINTVPKLVNTFIRPVMEFGAPAYFPSTKRECFQLERVQRLATRMIPDLRYVTYIERCVATGMFTLEYRRTRMDLITIFKAVCLDKLPSLKSIFQPSKVVHTRGHQFKLDRQRIIRTPDVYSLPGRAVSLWNNLPKHVVDAPSVDAFKDRLDQYLWNSSSPWKRDPIAGEAYPRSPLPPHLQ